MFEWIISGLQTITVKDLFYGICTIVPGVIALYIAYKSSKEQSELTNKILEKATRPYLCPGITDLRPDPARIEKETIYLMGLRIENFGRSVALINYINFDPPTQTGGIKNSVTDKSMKKSEMKHTIGPDRFIEIQAKWQFADSESPSAKLTLGYESSFNRYDEVYLIHFREWKIEKQK